MVRQRKMDEYARLVTWNVNGIRAAMRKGFVDSVKKMRPDLLCLQEHKACPEQVDLSMKGYESFWNIADKKGYAGTLILSRYTPKSVSHGIGVKEHDQEGRVLTLEFNKVFVVTVYTPNSQRGLARLEYRRKWDKVFLQYVRKLEKKKPVIFCGDLNVAHQEIDLANPKSNTKNAGFTLEERQGFDRIVKAGFVDVFRYFDSSAGKYTWWTYRHNARERNIGWRIDYFCASEKLIPSFKQAKILDQIYGSDHCPVQLDVDHNLFV